MARLIPALVALALLLPAAAAHAGSAEVGIADDRVLLAGGQRADRAVAEWRALGVDVVRIFAHWGRIAPAPTGRRRPPGFDAADPASRGYFWAPLDAAVARVRGAGMRVTLSITGPGPLWSSSQPRRRRPAYRPRAAAYRDFATAVARRYGEDVNRYILWNEPNISTWLSPQARCSRGRCTPVSPHLYRALVRAAYPAVRAADPGARVLIGTLSPRGQRLRASNTVMRPLVFLRAMACRSDRYKRLRTGACRRFRPATGNGFAMHPHSGRIAPERTHPNPDDVALASIRRLTRALDRLQRLRGLRATTRRFGIFIDEYGYQTRPPDPIAGIRPRQQDQWLQRAAYVAWKHSRIKLFTQYLWRDEPRSDDGSLSGWQSGLRFSSGRAKPSLAHFDTPFVLDRGRGRLWGQVRPGRAHTVTVEQRRRGRSTWRPLVTLRTNGRGYWAVKRRLRPGTSYRFRVAGRVSAVRRR